MENVSEERIEKKYEKAISQIGETQTIFPTNAKLEMAEMVEQIARTDKILSERIQNTNQSPGVKGGFAAEETLAESYNLDAILKKKPNRAITDRYEEWKATGLKGNDEVVDIAVINKDKTVTHEAQSKFYESAESTAREMSATKNGSPKYKNADSLIGPTDQIDPKDGSVSIGEHAEARAGAEQSRGNTVESEAAKNTAHKSTDKVKADGAESKSFTKKDAEEVGVGSERGKKVREDYQKEYQKASTLKHMGKAAIGAAAISGIASGAFNTYTYCKMVKEGKITEKEAVIKIVAETTASAADSAIKASANVGIQSLIVKYGSKELTKQLAKNSVRSMARTNLVTIGVLCGIDLIKDLVKLSLGKIDKKQFEERSGKNLINTSTGVFGASIGATLLSGGALAPFIGGIAGGLIATMAMQFAIENHIEKPFKELVLNTAVLYQSMSIFEQVSYNILEGQIVFEQMNGAGLILDDKFRDQNNRNINASNQMSSAINKL